VQAAQVISYHSLPLSPVMAVITLHNFTQYHSNV
jgi:hypothetical protein